MLKSRIEDRYQAFAHEVEQMREEWERATQGQSDETEVWIRKLQHLDRQMKGLKSFALHVEKYLAERHPSDDGAPALDVDKGQERRKSSRERQRRSTEHTPGASSSSHFHLAE